MNSSLSSLTIQSAAAAAAAAAAAVVVHLISVGRRVFVHGWHSAVACCPSDFLMKRFAWRCQMRKTKYSPLVAVVVGGAAVVGAGAAAIAKAGSQ